MTTTAVTFSHVWHELRRHGLLLESDRAFPSVVALVAGQPVRGSWWAHPKSHEIYDVAQRLGDHRDVIVCKLVSGKNTFVHRRLWPALLTVATARDAWQLDGLSPLARKLFDAVDTAGELRTDAVPRMSASKKDSPGEAARELERHLLVYADEVHTERGAHCKRLMTWRRWARRAGATKGRMTAERGRRDIEDALAAQIASSGGRGRLPWERRP